MKKTKQKIERNFNFMDSNVVSSFVQGEDAKALYNEVSKTIKSGVWYDEDSKTMRGSSTFLSARVDSIARNLGQGIRVATLADLSRPEIMKIMKDKFYSDTPAIVLRSLKDSFEQNRLLIKQLAPMIEKKVGKLNLPVLIIGFDVKPSKSGEGYGLDIVARDDFSVLQDERLSGKYDGQRFSNVDENGLPIFDNSGSRTWFARNQGISRLCLNRNLDLYSWCYGDDSLAYSYDYGRVALVRDAVAVGRKKVK